MLSASARAQLLPHLSPEPTDTILQPVAQRMCCRLITRFIHAMVTSRNCAVKLDCVAQQRDVTPRLTITRFRSGVSSMAISPRPSASLMAARALALPMLARSAIRATGDVAPSFYPATIGVWSSVMPCWAVVAAVRGAKPSVERSAADRRAAA